MKKYFITGLLVLVPLVITFLVLSSLIHTMDQSLLLLPEAWRPKSLVGFEVPGIGALLTLVIIFVTGLVATNIFGRQLITLGTATSTLVSPKEVFRGAILSGAVAIVVAHNHPSGDPGPSQADITVTRALREAAKILEIELLDHVVVGDVKSDPLGRGFFSFREAGYL